MWMEKLNFKYIAVLLLCISQFTAAQRLPEENFLKGIALLQQENYDSALISFTLSKGQNEKDALTWYYTGLIYYKRENNRQALENFLVAEKLDPGSAALMIAKIYARDNNVDRALEYLDIHLKTRDKKPENEIMTDPDFQRIESTRQWIEFWKSAQYYSPFDQLMAEAKYLAKSEEYTEAINMLSEGLRRGYRSSPLLAERAKIYQKTGNESLALKDINDAISRDSRNPELYILRGELNFKLGNFNQSAMDYGSALNYQPANLSLYLSRAVAFGKDQSYEEARKDIELYLEYFPASDEAWYEYGRINMEGKKYLDALRCLNKAITLNQSEPDYYLARGESYFQSNTLKYASNDLSMALDLDPTNAEAYFLKGLTSLKLGDREMACFAFRKAFQYGKKEAFNYIDDSCK